MPLVYYWDEEEQKKIPVSENNPLPTGGGGGGSDGKSAYEIALDNGFEGTETEWLASLKGEQGSPGQDADPQFTQEQVAALLVLIEDDA